MILDNGAVTIFNRVTNGNGTSFYARPIASAHVISHRQNGQSTRGLAPGSEININIDCTAEPVQIGAYRYIDPEGWAALGDKTGYITLQPGLDLIMVGEWDGEEVIDSGDYSRGGFPDYLRRNYAGVYNLAKASGPFSLIPHVELEGT